MLLLLLLGFGTITEADPESPVDLVLRSEDSATIDDMNGPFIPMPEHLKTAEGMIAWMTRDLPRLTAEYQKSRS